MAAESPVQAAQIRALPGAEHYDRVPPHNLDAEVSVLGSMLLSKDAIAEITEIMGPDDFYRGAHRTMFEAMRDLYDRGEPVDPITLADELEHRGSLEDVGGAVAVADLVSRVPTSANASYYGRIVADQAMRRRLIDAGTHITRIGYDAGTEADDAVDAAEALVYQVAQRDNRGEFTSMKELLNASFELIERLHENDSAITGLATGFTDLDQLTAGLQPSNLVILAARPAMGKSTLVTNVATHVAVEQRKSVVLFSLEMSKMELVQRILSAEARVDSERLRTGRLRDDDWPKLSQAMGRLAEAPLFIDDTPGINMMEIRSKARRLKQRHGLDLLIVDYLQLMQSHRRVENRVQEVAEFSRGLKILAKELDIPVIGLSQLSRKPEDRTDRRPQLSDLRESGCFLGSTRLTRADTNEAVEIQDLYRQGATDVPVWAVEHETGRLVQARMSHVFHSGIKPVFQLRLASGRAVTASGNHPFLRFDGWTALDDLAVGDRIAVPRRLPAPSNRQPADEREVVLLAHLIGDGCVIAGQSLRYTSQDPDNLDVVERCAKELFGIQPRRVLHDDRFHTDLPSPDPLTHRRRHPIVEWLAQWGLDGKRGNDQHIPAWVKALPEDQIRIFLQHLWATDGCVAREAKDHGVAISYATSSRRFAEDVAGLLLRLGIVGRLASRAQHSGSEGVHDAHHVRVSGLDEQIRFLREVGVFGQPSARIPALLELLEGNRADTTADASDLFWDRVVAITPMGEAEVFDATVVEHHNMIADGVIAHNSIEQDADIVGFIYRDEVYDPESSARGEAELIVAKHRNGPLRTVRLSFMGHHSRFANLARGGMPTGNAPI